MADQPLRVAIIGLGGFAGDHHRTVRTLEERGECRLICTCDPNPDAFQERRQSLEFDRRGVKVYTDFREMLDAHAGDLDIATIPTPVPLHAPMHRTCVDRGLACYLEKPPTVNYAELDEMLAVDERAKKRTQVGFNFIVEQERQALKKRLLDGEFGALRRLTYLGLTPRLTSYYTRAAWPGRLMMDGRLVLDSVIGNAVSHYLFNLLFWAGRKELFDWSGVVTMESELYRAHAIEGVDTFLACGRCEDGVEIAVAATHACDGDHVNRERIECERATIERTNYGPFRIEWKDGRHEEVPLDSCDLVVENFAAYFRYVRGESPRPLIGLADTRPFVEYNDLAYVAAGRIGQVGGDHITRTPAANGAGETVSIQGVRSACETFLDTRKFPSAQGAPWSNPGGSAVYADLAQLRPTVERMAAAVSSGSESKL